MRTVVVLLLGCVVIPAPAAARTWHVLPDGSGDAPTIQAAVDSSAHGDTVLVAPGTYLEHVDIQWKTLTLRSELGPGVTTITGGGLPSRYPVVCVTDVPSGETSVEGFTITGGQPEGSVGGAGMGCGIFQGEGRITVRGNAIRGNVGTFVGGMGVTGRGVFLAEGNLLEGNSSARDGGGLLVDEVYDDVDLTILNNVIRGNTSLDGGGGLSLHVTSGHATVSGNLIEENCAQSGGGMFAGGDISFEDNVLSGNRADLYGGGVACTGTAEAPALVGDLFIGNSADVSGGGVYLHTAYPFLVQGCTFAGNRAPAGSAFYEAGTLRGGTISHTIVAGNEGGAAIQCHQFGDLIAFECCDIWGNVPTGFAETCSDPTGTDGNFSEDPQFCDAALGDYTLCASSPCLEGYGCGLVGALEEGCGPSATEPTTWGTLKTLFR